MPGDEVCRAMHSIFFLLLLANEEIMSLFIHQAARDCLVALCVLLLIIAYGGLF
jgi:hypothetical protein